jgi:hypothetical protein
MKCMQQRSAQGSSALRASLCRCMSMPLCSQTHALPVLHLSGAATYCSPLAGPLLKLHWYVYSMATPINYKLTLLDTASPEAPATMPDIHQQQQQPAGSSSSSSSSASAHHQVAAATDGAAVGFSGSGFAHMEKNWGAAFPEQWVWAQGISGDGKVRCSNGCGHKALVETARCDAAMGVGTRH